MKWGEFKQAVEAFGVKNETEVDWIDWSPSMSDRAVEVVFDEQYPNACYIY